MGAWANADADSAVNSKVQRMLVLNFFIASFFRCEENGFWRKSGARESCFMQMICTAVR
jgi:hypothetical protein